MIQIAQQTRGRGLFQTCLDETLPSWTFGLPRNYDPTVGRFMTHDAYAGNLSQPISLNKYLYADANPVMNIDPSGMISIASLITQIGIGTTLVGVATYGLGHAFNSPLTKDIGFATVIVGLNLTGAGATWMALSAGAGSQAVALALLTGGADAAFLYFTNKAKPPLVLTNDIGILANLVSTNTQVHSPGYLVFSNEEQVRLTENQISRFPQPSQTSPTLEQGNVIIRFDWLGRQGGLSNLKISRQVATYGGQLGTAAYEQDVTINDPLSIISNGTGREHWYDLRR